MRGSLTDTQILPHDHVMIKKWQLILEIICHAKNTTVVTLLLSTISCEILQNVDDYNKWRAYINRFCEIYDEKHVSRLRLCSFSPTCGRGFFGLC